MAGEIAKYSVERDSGPVVERTVQRVELSVTQKAGNRYCEWMDTDVRHWTDVLGFKTLIIMVEISRKDC